MGPGERIVATSGSNQSVEAIEVRDGGGGHSETVADRSWGRVGSMVQKPEVTAVDTTCLCGEQCSVLEPCAIYLERVKQHVRDALALRELGVAMARETDVRVVHRGRAGDEAELRYISKAMWRHLVDRRLAKGKQ